MGMDQSRCMPGDLVAGQRLAPCSADSSVENNLGVKTASVEFEALSPRIETVG